MILGKSTARLLRERPGSEAGEAVYYKPETPNQSLNFKP